MSSLLDADALMAARGRIAFVYAPDQVARAICDAYPTARRYLDEARVHHTSLESASAHAPE